MVGAVTATVIVQLPPAVIVPPDSESVLLPLVAPVTVPLQVLVSAGVAATTNPVGNASVNATPLKASALLFERVMDRVDVPFCGMLVGENDFTMMGMKMALAAGESANSIV